MKVSEEELEARRQNGSQKLPQVTTGYLARYAALVTSADKGAVLKA